MIPEVVIVIGSTRCGKSTFVEKFSKDHSVVAVQIGRVIRQSVGMAPANNEANPNRWAVTENLARELFIQFGLLANSLNRTLLLDGWPRDGQQADWLIQTGFKRLWWYDGSECVYPPVRLVHLISDHPERLDGTDLERKRHYQSRADAWEVRRKLLAWAVPAGRRAVHPLTTSVKLEEVES